MPELIDTLAWHTGDNRPQTLITLRDGDGPLDLTGAHVSLHISLNSNPDVAVYFATFTTEGAPTLGQGRITPNPNIPAGKYRAVLRAVKPGPQQVTIPNTGYWPLHINDTAT